jgi:uncharacterized protein YqjF (DUF2071 family)
MPGPFLTAEWRWLAMLNFRADPELLKPYVPAGTELDAWCGETLVSIVGFRFLNTRLSGVAIPWHRDFDEVNLRFYVRREADGQIRRGVTFLRELVPRRAIAWLARAVYNEPYAACRMRSETGQRCRYSWRIGGRWHSLEVQPRGDPAPLEEGSPEEFVAERYWGYTRGRGGRTIEYRVEHPRWRVWRTAEARLDCDIAAVYGTRFAGVLNQKPCSAFLADGSAVTVYRPVWLP